MVGVAVGPGVCATVPVLVGPTVGEAVGVVVGVDVLPGVDVGTRTAAASLSTSGK